jgi:hypothetical protein
LPPKKIISAAHFFCQKSNFAAQKNKNVAAQKNNFATQSNKFAAHFTNSQILLPYSFKKSSLNIGKTCASTFKTEIITH